jgi:peptidyl-prolyl cis-trans isomerase A (cyclophilin A)/peptidyl-prolyl cis-trans isomerase B (cyclophilin B)
VQKLPFLLLAPALALFNHTAIGAIALPSIVELQTNLGTITIQVNHAKVPITSKNFINYATKGFYKDTLIHRVQKGFVMQGGGVDKASGQFKTGNPAIKNEASNGLSNLTGTIAMARTSEPNSATSQFYINLADNSQLLDYSAAQKKPGYAVFGKVIKGTDVVASIGNSTTFSNTQLPYTSSSELIFVDNVYTSTSINNKVAATRITVNGKGKVASTPSGINCGTHCSLSQPVGAALKLTAIPVKGYYFAGWRGDCKGVAPTISINTNTGNHNCTALFFKTAAEVQ